jgi:hypothetical protein
MGVSGQRHAPAALLPPGKEPPVPIGQEAGWAPEPVWTQRIEEKSFAPAGDRTPVVKPVVRHYTAWATRLLMAYLHLLKILYRIVSLPLHMWDECELPHACFYSIWIYSRQYFLTVNCSSLKLNFIKKITKRTMSWNVRNRYWNTVGN